MASATNHVSLLVARDEEAKKEFQDLIEKYGLHSGTGSARNSPSKQLAGQPADSLSSGSSSSSSSPLLLHPKGINTDYQGKPSLAASLQTTTNDSLVHIITVSKGTVLGLNIVGGINRNEGPLVYILEVIPGGDCYKDGRLRPGDQLVSINKESLIGVTYEEAQSLLQKTKLRSDSSWEIAFVRQEAIDCYVENTKPAPGHLPSGGHILQCTPQTLSPVFSPNEHLATKMSTLNMKKARFKARDQSSVVSVNNTADVTAGATSPSCSDDYVPPRRKISLNPTLRLQADKLKMFVANDTSETDEMEGLRKERNDALKEICKLKKELAESECVRKQLTEEMETAKQEAKASVEETRALRSRIHLAEAAQMQARRMEMDYEEVIHLLEAEITELKAQHADQCGQNKDSVKDLRTRITVLDCQLKKSETAKKTFEVVTEKLLQFVEVVHEALSDNFTSQSNLSDRKVTFSSKTLLARLGRNGHTVPASLSTEARELAKSVRAILEADCLPYGWEEAYTADGIKYFINHVTQTTSWIHPVTNVLTLPSSEENEDDGYQQFPDPKS